MAWRLRIQAGIRGSEFWGLGLLGAGCGSYYIYIYLDRDENSELFSHQSRRWFRVYGRRLLPSTKGPGPPVSLGFTRFRVQGFGFSFAYRPIKQGTENARALQFANFDTMRSRTLSSAPKPLNPEA